MPAGFSHIRSIATGNFFGNSHADLVVAGGEGYNNVLLPSDPAGVALFKNDGQGHFTYQGEYLAAVTPYPGGGNGQGDTVNPEHVNVADLNNDGKPDLVLSLYDHNIDVFLNNGNGTFQSAVAYTTETPGSVGGYPRGVAFGDFNGDGKVDIASLNFGEPVPADQSTPQPGSVGVLYGNGDGTFQAPIQYTPYKLPGGVAVGDFNGDGLPDLAVTQNYDDHSVGLMLNQPNTATQPPTVTGVNPANGPTSGGTQVTITGTNFAGTTQVSFGSVRVSSFTVVNSNTSITATAPAEVAGTVDITVYNAGASATSAADRFTFTAAAASVSGTDATTQGNWRSAYGHDGFDLEGDAGGANPSLPSYARVSLAGASPFTWGTDTGSPYALGNAADTGDLAATWYSPTSFDIDVNLTDGQAHQLTLYALDWDSVMGSPYARRSERLDVLDAATGVVLASQTIASFKGEYVGFNISGGVILRVTNMTPAGQSSNAVVSGVFFG
jgi:hypothetical protein